jgi:hypothetical protein
VLLHALVLLVSRDIAVASICPSFAANLEVGVMLLHIWWLNELTSSAVSYEERGVKRISIVEVGWRGRTLSSSAKQKETKSLFRFLVLPAAKNAAERMK